MVTEYCLKCNMAVEQSSDGIPDRTTDVLLTDEEIKKAWLATLNIETDYRFYNVLLQDRAITKAQLKKFSDYLRTYGEEKTLEACRETLREVEVEKGG